MFSFPLSCIKCRFLRLTNKYGNDKSNYFSKQSTITLFGLYAIASVNEAPYRGLKIRLMLKFITWLMVMANRNIK